MLNLLLHLKIHALLGKSINREVGKFPDVSICVLVEWKGILNSNDDSKGIFWSC